MPNESTRTVWVALAAGLGVALTKAFAAAFTGSPAMAAEASHSLADTANDLFLLVAQRRSTHRPDDQHPLGYGREAYFWALIAATGVFVAGAAFSLREGIAELIHPSVTSSFAAAYVVLAVSAVFDLISFRQSGGQMSAQARRRHRDLLDQSRATSDPMLRAVFVEDAVATMGDVLAFAGLALNQITGSSIPQGVAAVLIALMLVRTSVLLIRRNHDFLVGAWLLTPTAPGKCDGDRSTGSVTSAVGDGMQPGEPADEPFTHPLQPSDEQRLRTFLLGYPGVIAIGELLVLFLGPSRIWVVARLDVDDDLRGDQIKSLVRGIESGLKHVSESIYRVDVVIGGQRPRRRQPSVASLVDRFLQRRRRRISAALRSDTHRRCPGPPAAAVKCTAVNERRGNAIGDHRLVVNSTLVAAPSAARPPPRWSADTPVRS